MKRTTKKLPPLPEAVIEEAENLYISIKMPDVTASDVVRIYNRAKCLFDQLWHYKRNDEAQSFMFYTHVQAMKHPEAPSSFLEEMFHSGKGFTDLAIAHPNFPVSLLVPLASAASENWHPSSESYYALKNPSLPVDLIAQLFDRAVAAGDGVSLSYLSENPALPHVYMMRSARYRCSRVRLGLASNPRVTPSLLEYLAGDQVVQVRKAVAEHNDLPAESLARLAKDKSAKVRAVAGWRYTRRQRGY